MNRAQFMKQATPSFSKNMALCVWFMQIEKNAGEWPGIEDGEFLLNKIRSTP